MNSFRSMAFRRSVVIRKFVTHLQVIVVVRTKVLVPGTCSRRAKSSEVDEMASRTVTARVGVAYAMSIHLLGVLHS